MNQYKPEGSLFKTDANQRLISSYEGLCKAMNEQLIVEARVVICDSSHNLIVDLPCGKGIILREEGAIGITDGKTRDIALISRVNKIVCFIINRVDMDENGLITAYLSRKSAQEECVKKYINCLSSGDIISAKVTHLEQFGSFVDIGCGIPSLIPIDAISVSRISHPSDRFSIGQNIKAVVKSNENGRICLSHKELLGTWDENASEFEAGETVSGIVRSVEEYGIFVELAPNLAGLAEPREGIKVGQRVSVYIKALIPDKMKVKLIIVDVCDDIGSFTKCKYFCNENHINKWRYTPNGSSKVIESSFI